MDSLTTEASSDILRAIREPSLSQDLARMRRTLFVAAVRYADLRARWALANREERALMDEERRRAHDAFISTCDALSRGMEASELGTTWRRQLGQDRKQIGDFACYVQYALAIGAG